MTTNSPEGRASSPPSATGPHASRPERPDLEALLVAMTLVPGLYPRNRMFKFYDEPGVRQVRARAAMIRGVVKQLSGVQGRGAEIELRHDTVSGRCFMQYRLERLRYQRKLDLSEIEAACVVYLLAHASIATLTAGPRDRALVEAALARLGQSLVG